MKKIQIKLDISSDVYNDEAMERICVELKRKMLGFVFECIDSAPVGLPDAKGTIHQKFAVNGGISLVFASPC